MISLLKLLSVAEDYWHHTNFNEYYFWDDYLTAIKSLITKLPKNENEATFMQTSKAVAEEVLE